MIYKKWLIKTLGLTFSILTIFAGFNYFIDPLWTFKHSHNFNDIQEAFNERQQKTNYITFHDFEYDSLLLGSSRTTYLNQNDFKDYKVYNYAVSSMSVQEYNGYIEYAKRLKGSDFETIIIGLDFFATREDREPENPRIYIDNTNEFLYRFKSLISVDTFKHSIKNFVASYKNEYNPSFLRNYDRANVANLNKRNEGVITQNIENTVIQYSEKVYDKTYKYNENYIEILKELKMNNPNTKFVIFTTPVSAPLFKALIKEGRINDYKRWLKDTVSVFGEVNHFMYINSITEDLSNYYDGHHYYPSVGRLIAHKLINYPDSNIPIDFGLTLTPENIEEYLNEIAQNKIND